MCIRDRSRVVEPCRVIEPFSFVMRLNRMNTPAACCLLPAACCHFSIFIGSFLYQRAKPPQGIVLFINLLGKGLTPRACMGDAASIWCALVFSYIILTSTLISSSKSWYWSINRVVYELLQISFRSTIQLKHLYSSLINMRHFYAIILEIVLTKAAPALFLKWSGEYFLKWLAIGNNRLLFLPFFFI